MKKALEENIGDQRSKIKGFWITYLEVGLMEAIAGPKAKIRESCIEIEEEVEKYGVVLKDVCGGIAAKAKAAYNVR